MRPVVILFAKAPVPGRVKTRLAATLGAEAAAALHRAFVADMIEMLLTLRGRADVELHTDIPTDAWQDAAVPCRLQPAGDLGVRMYAALGGRSHACIIGSDAPTLPAAHVAALLDDDADVTLAPSTDGGYWGIAARRVDPAMFDGVAWSTERALAQTEAACRACGFTVARGPEWFDIDTPDDLARLRGGALPRHTAALLGEPPQ